MHSWIWSACSDHKQGKEMNLQKKSLTFMKSKSVVVLALSLIMAACSSSSSKSDPAGDGPLTGNWQMSLQPSNTKLKPNPQSGFLVQSSEAVTGSVSVTDAPCSGVAPVTGTVTGNTVSLTLSPSGIEVILDGNLDSGNTSMSGTYNILSTGCSGTETAPQSGTWTANVQFIGWNYFDRHLQHPAFRKREPSLRRWRQRNGVVDVVKLADSSTWLR
jgi:hypothetical protein